VSEISQKFVFTLTVDSHLLSGRQWETGDLLSGRQESPMELLARPEERVEVTTTASPGSCMPDWYGIAA
jgi:hypothetical protein